MNREEIIQRLKNISEHAVHSAGKQRYIMSLDDGIALCEAAEMLEKEQSVIDSVLETIDTQLEALADGKYGGASALNYVYEAVLALESGERE